MTNKNKGKYETIDAPWTIHDRRFHPDKFQRYDEINHCMSTVIEDGHLSQGSITVREHYFYSGSGDKGVWNGVNAEIMLPSNSDELSHELAKELKITIEKFVNKHHLDKEQKK